MKEERGPAPAQPHRTRNVYFWVYIDTVILSGDDTHDTTCFLVVKIWDAVGGILKSVFKGITEADITAVCLDDR